jgi:starvation-inducible DNA-binding protein
MPAIAQELHKTKIDLSEEIRQQMVDLLNQQLADTADLYSQTKQAHWNVKGPNFIALHELFDEIAEHVEEHIDRIAERVTALGGTAFGTTRMAAAASTLREYPSDIFDGKDHVNELSSRFAAYAASTRKAIDIADEAHDATTADLFTQISGVVDKDLWFIEAHQQR